jgi:hypothetical protein
MSPGRYPEIAEALREAAAAMASLWPLRKRQLQRLPRANGVRSSARSVNNLGALA